MVPPRAAAMTYKVNAEVMRKVDANNPAKTGFAVFFCKFLQTASLAAVRGNLRESANVLGMRCSTAFNFEWGV